MASEPPTPARLFIVEDDPALRRLLESLLRGEGYEVASAADGNAAFETLVREHFDLVLIDVWLPGPSGPEVLARLRRAGRPARAIVMTGDPTPETVLKAVREHALQYIAKPFTPDDMLKRVRRALALPATVPPVEVISASPQWVELLVPCDRETAEGIREILMRLESDLPDEVREAVGHAFRELLLNAVEWGGGFDPSKRVRISFLRGKRVLLYRIADPGRGFRFEGLAHAAVTSFERDPLEHARVRETKGMRAGGLGILIARAVVDELIYNEAQNEVVFMKYLDEPEEPASRA